ncbi:DinB superfamily protein [Evansella caseinilytica]|uniref:DinB superfamily protein n=1 Tax=Evansella caseinilytica TaxID=1503961 RepID=A0A1H3Q4C9_9BACI|nr:DinB family protein [Evansella caseinilytica]SDZ08113.1 DinB superfamily protein [Evansella caseinilytica]
MSKYLVEQLKVVRNQMIEYVQTIPQEQWEVIPAGLNNNTKWNVGHMYIISERLAFQLPGEKIHIPEHFPELFNPRTSPENWHVEPPAKDELIGLLKEQAIRLEALLAKIEEPLKKPYQTSTGFKMATVAECLSFNLFHEGMHFAAIKNIKQLLAAAES